MRWLVLLLACCSSETPIVVTSTIDASQDSIKLGPAESCVIGDRMIVMRGGQCVAMVCIESDFWLVVP